ncbi:hypothetical protein RN001_013639 [Aquatica leii]|uniref:DNA-directed DNA polymerase n=1 Tax=Aquatica leii TaxID=1421715 RepID=A0AAN7PQW2_9COLE|nr:hypothetical protein RN001_013639 [Aquatica leii]
MVWIKRAFEELKDYTLKNLDPSDLIGFIIRNPNFADKPIGISFRRSDQLNTAVILTAFEKILQSNAQFFSRELLTIQVDSVRLPIGYGRTNLTGLSFEQFCDKKVGIIVTPNKDNLCLASAVVLGIAFKNRDPDFSKMKIGLPILRLKSIELCVASNVDLSKGGSYEHIKRIQDYLVGYTIVVYNSRLGATTYFEGPRSSDRVTINLLLENKHYNLITSLTSAFTTSYFCEFCKHRTSNKNGHRRCLYTCPACHTSPPCQYQNNRIVCDKCHRDFRGENCYLNHNRADLCKKLKRCRTCFVTTWTAVDRNHKCGFKFCYICQKQQPVRHFCYMTKSVVKNTKKNLKTLFIFFDLECKQETLVDGTRNHYLHKPNLCVAAHVCFKCLNDEDINNNCSTCGTRLNVFNEEPVISFLNYVSSISLKFDKITVLAHNFKGYDGCFVLKQIIKEKQRWNPKIISTGTKIIAITCDKIRFIDSLNYMPLPLSKLPKTFDFPGSKGYFPFLFNTSDNENYVGPMPDHQFYATEQMHADERKSFLTWYAGEINSGSVFNMKNEILKYCIMDVQILVKACLRFWKLFKTENNVDCFQEATTIASACNLAFRRNFLINNTIGLIPPGGYRLNDKQSSIAIKWLDWVAQNSNISIQHAGNAREFRLPEGILVDGYCFELKTVYEFLGCYWHGCENCFPNQTGDFEQADVKSKSDLMFLRREHTQARADSIRNFGYELVQIWECKFKQLLNTNCNIRNFVENNNHLKNPPLNPRDAFFGGRTNAAKLYHKCNNLEKIFYFDITSLYPYINKYAKYPIGHPTIYIGHNSCSKLPINTVEGLIKCVVLPPRDLYHPVLPYRLHKKLMFILCRSCAEILNQNTCHHNESERSFVGTFVADELRKALSLNYKILEFHEIWEYKIEMYDSAAKTGGLFTGYIDNFLKLKQENSGWPASCQNEIQKEKYIKDYFQKEGVQLRKEKICKNSGMRYISKLMLNSFWGKFGQRENLTQTSIITNPREFFKLLTDPDVEVQSLIPVDDEVIILSWNRRDDSVKPLKTVNVAIAAYTTAFARLELYKYLENLGRNVLYYDTDSIIFIHKEGDWKPASGEFLGMMKDELEEYGSGSYIDEFVSGGPKNYSFKIYTPTTDTYNTVCKVKGITLNYKNSKVINFEKIREMVCENGATVHVNTDRKIVRTPVYEVISKPEQKRYSLEYNKRRRLPDCYDTLPYGFVNI